MNKSNTHKENQEIQIKVIVDPEIGQGRFSNLANISHSPEEFTLDFLYMNPSPPPFGKMVSRVVMTPGHAKRFLTALKENLSKFENQFGEIRLADPSSIDSKKIN